MLNFSRRPTSLRGLQLGPDVLTLGCNTFKCLHRANEQQLNAAQCEQACSAHLRAAENFTTTNFYRIFIMNPLFFPSHALVPKSPAIFEAQLISLAQFDFQNVTPINPTWERT